MADNRQIAADVLAAVGGAENIQSAIHCQTRLRLTLNDQSVPDEAQIKKIKGVLGTTWAGTQFQVIIGQNVPSVYQELLTMGVKGGGAIDVNEGDKEPLTPKAIFGNILNYLSKSMVATIPVMMAAAMFRTVAVVLGPSMLGVLDPESTMFMMLNDWLYSAGFWFMPIYLGYAAANVLGASPMLGMMIGGILMAPEFANLVAAMAEGGPSSILVYGLFPAPIASYGQTVLPTLLSVAVLYFVEKFFKKVIPDMLSVTFVPWFTMIVMVPITLCALAPLGSFLGVGLGAFLSWFAGVGGFVAVAVICALWEFIIMTGMHVALFGLILPSFMEVGFDSCVLVAAWIAQAAAWGMAFGAFLRLKDPDEKGAQLGYVISGVIGGVSEPALYGTGFKFTRCLAGMIAGGLAGGGFAGLFGAKLYVMGATNILGIINFAQGGTGNLIIGALGYAIAFAVATVVTFLFGFTKEQLDEDRAAAGALPEAKAAVQGAKASTKGATPVAVAADKDAVVAPVSGKIEVTSKIPDPVFASEMMGKTVAIWPDEGIVYAPASGTVTTAMPHAFGIMAEDGTEVLVHIGVDTVAMNGDGFTIYGKVGDTVQAGEPMVAFDKAKVKAAGHPDIVMTIITNSDDLAEVQAVAEGSVTAGQKVIVTKA